MVAWLKLQSLKHWSHS